MIRKSFAIIISLTCLFTMQRCAQVGPLTGGVRDTMPPKLVESIPPNRTTNFYEKEIILKFDEFIKLIGLSNQLVISPQVKTLPEIEAEGKTIKIKLDPSVFEPGKTYRIDFGNAIADMHEGNRLDGFNFVFSTGPIIDTLKISGKVSYAFNNKDFPNALIGLYPNEVWRDSFIFKTLPAYISKSNSSGDFRFFNLPPARYLVFAIDDKSKNQLYDGESEQVALLGPPLILNSDTIIELKMFKEESSKSFIKKTISNYYGFTQVVLNKPALVSLKTKKKNQMQFISETNVGRLKDTIAFFYKELEDTLSIIIENNSYPHIDTLNLIIPKKPNPKKAVLSFNLNENQGKLAYKQNLRITFSNWIDTLKFKTSALSLQDLTDSTSKDLSIAGYWPSANVYELKTKLNEGATYHLKINKDAFSSFENVSHDSLFFKFKTPSKVDFGKFVLKLKVSRKQNYVIQLINEKEDVIREVFAAYTVFTKGSAMFSFSDIIPGNYLVKVIFDNNENKKWDRGDVLISRLPEPTIISSKKIKIISDWETEEEIILGEKE